MVESTAEPVEVDVAALHARLRQAAATVAVAESLTGGLVTAALTEVPGASATVRGGLVVYATDLKSTVAGVPESLLAERGAVDADVALELARGARARLRATIGIGVTGVAGPEPQDGKVVGTVFVALSGPDGETVAERRFAGDRARIRLLTVRLAMQLLDRESHSLLAR
ncbi:MAG: CinA family protein [Jatrophihabitans sp.]